MTDGPPAHLSEFYSMISPDPNHVTVSDNNGVDPTAQTQFNHHHRSNSLIGAMNSMFRRPSFSSINTSEIPSSIASHAFAERMAQNHPELPALITKKDVDANLKSYDRLIQSSKTLQNALTDVSRAAAEFGTALDACASCKGAGSSSDSLSSAAGLFYLIANHDQVLANSIETAFEQPVKEKVNGFKQEHAQREAEFRSRLYEKTRALRNKEVTTGKMARQRTRNIQEYRASLLELTTHLDDIDRLKYEYFETAYQLTQDSSNQIAQHAASVVRAQIEISEGIARKGWSGGGLDELISTCPDPFENTRSTALAEQQTVGLGISSIRENIPSDYSGSITSNENVVNGNDMAHSTDFENDEDDVGDDTLSINHDLTSYSIYSETKGALSTTENSGQK